MSEVADWSAVSVPTAERSSVHVRTPRLETLTEPMPVATPAPRLSWQVVAAPGWRQTDWEARAETEDGGVETVRGASDDDPARGLEQVLVDWPFRPLRSRERRTVSVRVAGVGADGTPDAHWSSWSAGTVAEAGLLARGDWSAVPVGPAWPQEPATERRPALVRRDFTVDGEIARARLHVTAHGLCEVEINGTRVGDHELVPGWTSYSSRLAVWTYDVTEHLRPGPNAIGAWLGDGWYRGRLGFNGGAHDLYGADQALIAQLEITRADGGHQVVATDAEWQAAQSPILRSGLYDGEHHDARLEHHGWSGPGGGGDAWRPVRVGRRDPGTLQPAASPPARCTEELTPESLTRLDDGRFLLDFGQNLVGRLRVRVDGPAGRRIELRHAEVLQDGDLCLRPLRQAEARDVLILDGAGPRTWEPRFTFHGFRYATLAGVDALSTGDVVARVLHSDMPRTGTLETSNPDLDRLHENVVWGMRGNFLHVPTDCPQRDERLGWTGDIQVFAPTAAFLYDCDAFLGDWLVDLAVEQLPDGTVPWFVPMVPGGPSWEPVDTGAVWGDAAVLVPWTMHRRYGDEGVLARQYSSARAWVERIIRQAGPDRLWHDGAEQLGDWLDPAAPPDDPADARTDKRLVAQAYFAHSARRLAEIAETIGETDDARRYRGIAAEARAAFRAAHLGVDVRLSSDAQTAYALAITFELLDADEIPVAGERLAELLRAGGNRIGTGFAGTPAICDALSAAGQLDAAYDLLLQEECPSWLYTVRSGATTIWERWDSMLPDGTVNPGEMTSFNHYALGSVADWMHRVIGGLSPEEPGYRRVRWAPRPGGGLTHARVTFDSPYGRIEGSWECVDGGVLHRVSLPTGVDAVVDVPGAQGTVVGSGERWEHLARN